MKKNTTLERLLKVGSFSELFGLVSGFKLEKVIQKIRVWGITGKEFWSREGIETILAPYRKHSKQQNLSEKAIDEVLQSFAETAKIDINLVRRVFYQIAVEEKPKEKPEEIIEEAEEELPEIEEEEPEEETEGEQ